MGSGPRRLPLTIVLVDAVEPELARRALEDTLAQVEPDDVLVFSNQPLLGRGQFIEREPCSFDEVMAILWYEAPFLVKSPHFLVIQWDSWVLDGSRWRDEWFGLDFVGAPWGWHGDGHEVGNGGFSLRSTELARWVAHNPQRYQIKHPEDAALCREYRHRLEFDGFRWATVEQATEFAFERTPLRPTFGFHGAWNWPTVLDRDRLTDSLGVAGPYARGKVEWNELTAILQSAPSSSPPTETQLFSKPFSGPSGSSTS